MRLMKYIRKHKKISIIVFSCLVVFVLFTATFGRYIYNAIDNYILETKGFYFNSSVLGVNTKELNKKSIVSFVLVDNHHLNTHGVEYFCAL